MGRETESRSRSLPRGQRSPWILQGDSFEWYDRSKSDCMQHQRGQQVRWRPGQRLHHLFERRADHLSAQGNSCHLAIDSTECQWSYAQLDQHANQLARYLKLKGLGSGDVIGLLFDKSAISYAAMLAVLKINAAYVPLDIAFPRDRIAFIAEDADLKMILTLTEHSQLTRALAVAVVCLDQETRTIGSQSNSRLASIPGGQSESQLCYIIYTSGSTGHPKGVPIDHASICNFVLVAAEIYGYRSCDRVYQGLTMAFDFAVEEIWVPLVLGATLVPNQTGYSLLGRDLAAFLSDQHITALCCVPTLLATIDPDLPELRLLIVSGEACPHDLIARWTSPRRTILNAYGPTESTVTATLACSRPDEPVTIGSPLPTYSVIILEPGTEKVLPFGTEGEIAIAGVGVAKGYLNRPEQTQKVFIKDFLQIENNLSGLIYRTGDLGLINDNGLIEYRGRIDLQVKIRGYRIELSEIESVILQTPQIDQVVVSTCESVPNVKELVAYYTQKTGTKPMAADQLASILQNHLPNYMVPVFYEQLTALPMMASGKVDRKKLPQPSGTRLHAKIQKFVAPANGVERQMAAALSDVLNLDTVSVEDNFFSDLGANSLLMTRFSATLRDQFHWAEISMREIYLHPTVRKLSEFLQRSTQKGKAQLREIPVHKAKTWHYVLTGVAQLLTVYLLLYLGAVIFWEGSVWIMAAPVFYGALGRSLLFSGMLLAAAALLPVALKWILIGRFTPEIFPVWSCKYFTFWVIKTTLAVNPMRAFVGTPIFIAYLKMMGAQVSWNCNIQSPHIPIPIDLLTVGKGAVISPNVRLNGYRVESGWVRTGNVTIDRDAFIGPSSVIEINTMMEVGSELGHSSSLHENQCLKQGESYHGSPAQPASCRYRQLENGSTLSPLRQVIYTLFLILPALLLMPLFHLSIYYFFGVDSDGLNLSQAQGLLPFRDWHPITIFKWSLVIYLGTLVTGLLLISLVSRILNFFLKPERVYPLYGIHYILQRMLVRSSNSKFYNYLFGDSSFIVYFLRWIGYRFKGIVQTGSNFGMEQKHENPFLCHIGKGTMVSDGITIFNTTYAANCFKLSAVRLGGSSFLGNDLTLTPGSKTGENCLLGTKTMVPIDGPIRENTGLLGSPCFEIPRSVMRDKCFEHYKLPQVMQQRLRRKNAHNLVTMGIFLLVNFIPFFLTFYILWFTLPWLF